MEKMDPKIEELQKTFKTMSYGANVEDVSQAQKWLDNVTIVDKRSEIPQVLNNLRNLSATTKPTVESFISFAEALEKNINLICQIEISIRGILAKDTKKAVELLIQYVYSFEESASNVDILRPAVGVFKNQPLWIFGDFLKRTLTGNKGAIVLADLRFAHVATYITELATKAGFPNFIVIPTNDFECEFEDLGDVFFYASRPTDSFEHTFGEWRSVYSYDKTCSLVFENADLDSAVESTIEAAWSYQGMQPWSIDTVLIQESVFQKFTEKMKNRLKSLKIGSGSDKLADISYPLNSKISQKLLETVIKAKSLGIEVFQRDSKEPFTPTLLIGSKVYTNNVVRSTNKDSTVTLLPFRSIDEGVNLANNSKHGFAVSVWTENIGLANEVAQKLQMSNVWINGHGFFTPNIPFSSWKGRSSDSAEILDSGSKLVQVVDEAIAAAKTASAVLFKKTPIEKHKTFLKLHPILKETEQNDLIEWLKNQPIPNTFTQESYFVTPQKCPRGVFVLFLDNEDVRSCLEPVLISIYEGNGTIVITNNQSTSSVLQKIAKVIPSGLLTVLPSSQDAIGTAYRNENVDSHLTISGKPDKNKVLLFATKYKYIWTNIGQSSQCNL